MWPKSQHSWWTMSRVSDWGVHCLLVWPAINDCNFALMVEGFATTLLWRESRLIDPLP
jgi:hypothetical protein